MLKKFKYRNFSYLLLENYFQLQYFIKKKIMGQILYRIKKNIQGGKKFPNNVFNLQNFYFDILFCELSS